MVPQDSTKIDEPILAEKYTAEANEEEETQNEEEAAAYENAPIQEEEEEYQQPTQAQMDIV